MGRDTELFKAAQTGNIDFLEKVFSAYLAVERGKDAAPGKGKVKKQQSMSSLRKSANPNIQDDQGYTLLHHAALNGQRETVCLLLRCGASTTIPDCSGSCPLHLAAWKGDLEIVKSLVSQGPSRANVNQQSDADNTALHLAAQYGYSIVVEFLLQRHADPILHNSQGETPLDLAAQYGHLDTVHLLISHCPELLSLSRGKFSPLHLAARNGHTLVALSLINAGISVNVMGEHGTPLHEAAMFGKGATVKLLLDKGASIEAKDRASKSVIDLLSEFPAERAKEIRKMIEEHKEEVHQSGVSSHMVAVAKTSCKPVSDSSSALHYSAGDHIAVLRRTSGEMFEGSVNGKTGSFLAQDVTFHKEQGSHLSPVQSLTDLFPLSSSPTPSPPTILSSQQNHTPAPTLRSSAEQAHKSPSPPSTSPLLESCGAVQWNSVEGSPQASFQEKPMPPRMKKLSKKEKRFQLSKDDGAYCELSTIDPLAAKSEFGDNLRLNPIGPAFVRGSSESSKQGSSDTVTMHNSPNPAEAPVNAEQDQKQNEFMGSYYVLEVGNFDEGTAQVASYGTTSHSRQNELAEEGEREGGEEMSAAYYMLDIQHFNDEEGKTEDVKSKRVSVQSHRSSSSSVMSYENVVSPTPATKGAVYMNVKLKSSSSPPQYENITLRVSTERQKSMPLGIPRPNIRVAERSGVGGQEDTKAVRRMSSSLPSQSTADQDVEKSVAASTAAEEGKERSFSQGSEFVQGTCEEEPSQQRQRKRREQIYETTTVSFPKRDAQKSKRTPLKEIEIGHGQVVLIGNAQGSESKKVMEEEGTREETEGSQIEEVKLNGTGEMSSAEVLTEGSKPATEESREGVTDSTEKSGVVVAEEKSGARVTESEVTKIASVKENGTDGRERRREENAKQREGELTTKLIESNGMPFAGLVISASESSLLPSMRPRTETIWDDDRVQSEWSQIDSLLRDMSGTIGTSLTLSPLHDVAMDTTGRNHAPPASMQSWLAEHGMERYSSALESNGFDSLLFMGGCMLIKDDLEDIGITSLEDQLTLLATSRLLPPPPSVRSVDSVAEWLEALQLSQLAGQFEGLTLQKISKMWDIELTSVVGVELLGHRRRLLYGVSELCSAHPDWAMHSSPALRYRQRQMSVRQPAALSLYKDYTNIHPSPLPQSPPSASSSLPSAGIEIRPPHKAQGQVDSGVDRSPSLPSSFWHHDTATLIAETINYQAKYLGSVIVVRVRGTQSTEEACLRLRTSTENMQKLPDIILSISWKGVKFVDAESKMVVSTHSIQDISYCSQDIEDQRVFAYITKDKSGMFYCHVFMAVSKELSDEIVMTIGQAFEIAYQKVMKVRTRTTPPK